MTLGIIAGDFIYPSGELQQAMFPKETLAVILTAWITQAETKVASVADASKDTAASLWVYYRAYSAIAKRIGASPTSQSFGGNSGGGVESSIDWGQNKASYWEDLAAKTLAEFQYYVPSIYPSDSAWSTGYMNLDFIEPECTTNG